MFTNEAQFIKVKEETFCIRKVFISVQDKTIMKRSDKLKILEEQTKHHKFLLDRGMVLVFALIYLIATLVDKMQKSEDIFIVIIFIISISLTAGIFYRNYHVVHELWMNTLGGKNWKKELGFKER